MRLMNIDVGRGEAPAVVDGVEQGVTMLTAVGGCSELQMLPGFVDLPCQLGRRRIVEFVEPGVVVAQVITLVSRLQQPLQ